MPTLYTVPQTNNQHQCRMPTKITTIKLVPSVFCEAYQTTHCTRYSSIVLPSIVPFLYLPSISHTSNPPYEPTPKLLGIKTAPLDKSARTTRESEKSITPTTSSTNKPRRKSDVGAVENSRPTSPSTNKPRRKSDVGTNNCRSISPCTTALQTPPKRRNSSAVSVNVSSANSRANSRPTSPRNVPPQRRNSKSCDEYSYIGDKCHQQGSALQYHEYGRYHLTDIHHAITQAKLALDESNHGFDGDDNEGAKTKGKFHKDAVHRRRSM